MSGRGEGGAGEGGGEEGWMRMAAGGGRGWLEAGRLLFGATWGPGRAYADFFSGANTQPRHPVCPRYPLNGSAPPTSPSPSPKNLARPVRAAPPIPYPLPPAFLFRDPARARLASPLDSAHTPTPRFQLARGENPGGILIRPPREAFKGRSARVMRSWRRRATFCRASLYIFIFGILSVSVLPCIVFFFFFFFFFFFSLSPSLVALGQPSPTYLSCSSSSSHRSR